MQSASREGVKPSLEATTEDIMLRCIQPNQSVKRICRHQIRCVLEFEDNIYLIIKDASGENLLLKSKWNYYQGFKHVEEEVPKNVFVFARKIIDLNMVDSVRYPLNGEWYSVKVYANSERLKWNLRKIKKARKTSFITVISLLLHLTIATAFAGVLLYWKIDQAQEWLHSVFPSWDRELLKAVTVATEFVGCVILFIVFKHRRSLFDLYINAFVPIGIIISAGVLSCYWWMWIVIPFALIIAYVVSMIVMAILEGDEELRCIDYIRYTLVVFSFALMIFLPLGGLNAYSHTSSISDISDMSVEEAQKRHRENCFNLEQESWSTLTVQEKLDLLQAICDYECEFVLGCERVKIYSGITSRDTVLGEYSNQTKSFTINEDHLIHGNVEEVVDTVLHEIRHAYQHTWVEMYASLESHIKDEYKDLLPFKQAQSFSEEFSDYCSGEDDFYRYFTQDVERDAREWAAKRIKEYYATFIYPNR